MSATSPLDASGGRRAIRGGTGPLVSVVVPTYNRADLLRETVESVLAQTYRPIELIVVDDGSTDGTRALLESYGERIVYVRQENAGGTAARNTGTRLARGAYVNWLDHDDLMHPTKLERQVAYLERAPADIGLVHCGYYRIDEGGTVIDCLNGLPEGDVRERLLCGCFIWSGAPLVRRACVERVGLFDETVWSSDADMWLRIALAGYRFGCVQEPLGSYRILLDSSMADVARTERMDIAILDRIFGDPDVPPAVAAKRTDAYFNQRFWLATRYFTIGEWDAAGRNLTAALALRPELVEHPEDLLEWVSGSAFDPRVPDPLSYLANVFAHLPPAAAGLRAYRGRLLSQVALRVALRDYGRGRVREAKSSLARALRHDPRIFERPHEVAGMLHDAARRMEIPARTLLDTMLLHLPDEACWLRQRRRHLLGQMLLTSAFRDYWGGRRAAAVAQTARALARSPILFPWLARYTLWRGFAKARRSLTVMVARDQAPHWASGDASARALATSSESPRNP